MCSRHEILAASIKKGCVGSPIQAALDSLTALMVEHALTADDIVTLRSIMPDDRFVIVNDRDMPDVCLQHLLALTLVDGDLTFASSHDHARMRSEEHTSELQSLMRISYAVFCLKHKKFIPLHYAIHD